MVNKIEVCVWSRRCEPNIQNLTRDEATELKGKDPDHATRDLYEAMS